MNVFNFVKPNFEQKRFFPKPPSYLKHPFGTNVQSNSIPVDSNAGQKCHVPFQQDGSLRIRHVITFPFFFSQWSHVQWPTQWSSEAASRVPRPVECSRQDI